MDHTPTINQPTSIFYLIYAMCCANGFMCVSSFTTLTNPEDSSITSTDKETWGHQEIQEIAQSHRVNKQSKQDLHILLRTTRILTSRQKEMYTLYIPKGLFSYYQLLSFFSLYKFLLEFYYIIYCFFILYWTIANWELPQQLSGKESACNARGSGDVCLIPRSGRSPGKGHDNPLQYSCLEHPIDRGAWWASVRRVNQESDTTEAAQHTYTHIAN